MIVMILSIIAIQLAITTVEVNSQPNEVFICESVGVDTCVFNGIIEEQE
jgi:hypothetical protein